jgi:hypothetical protein
MRDNTDFDNADSSCITINNIASFTNIHFILPVSGKNYGFFFIGNGNENSNCILTINNCMFTTDETNIESILIFNNSNNAKIIGIGIIFDSLSSNFAPIYMLEGIVDIFLSDSFFENCNNSEFFFYLKVLLFFYIFLLLDLVE